VKCRGKNNRGFNSGGIVADASLTAFPVLILTGLDFCKRRLS
jgi:hypothetical protein